MAFDASDLSPHEQYVVDRTREGEIADFSPMAGPDGAKPTVRAGFLRKLLLGLDEQWPVRMPGVRIRGARIEGALDLSDCSGAGGAGLPALELTNCDIADRIDVSHARVARISIAGSRFREIVGIGASIDSDLDITNARPLGEAASLHLRSASIGGDVRAQGAELTAAENEHALDLQSAHVRGSVFLKEDFRARGTIWMLGARIGGYLACDGAHLLGASPALQLEGAQIGVAVLLRASFVAEGEVRLLGAKIAGDVDLSGALIRNEGGDALVLGNAEIGGQVIGDVKAIGLVWLRSARVAGNLDLRNAEISNPFKRNGASHKSEFNTALDATAARIEGAALLQGANIKGEVLLADARIDGYLTLGGGRFMNGGGWAIRAPNIRVGGNLTMKIGDDDPTPHGRKTVVQGGLKFDRARVDGAFSWLNLELRGPGPDNAKGGVLTLGEALIAGPLEARGLTAQEDARIDLSGASCGALDDDLKTGWGVEKATLNLEGFAYDRLEGGGRDDRWRARLAWLKRARANGFSPQPYATLARVYARAGLREDARRVLLAQHDLRARHSAAGPLTRLFSTLFGLLAGYGFAPIRAARALIVFLALGIAGVLAMDATGALAAPDGQRCAGAIEPALYAVDVALPVLDLGQQSLCAPGATPGASLFPGIELPNSEWRLFEGVALWRWGQALYAILGAILTALAVITFSGVLKPKAEE